MTVRLEVYRLLCTARSEEWEVYSCLVWCWPACLSLVLSNNQQPLPRQFQCHHQLTVLVMVPTNKLPLRSTVHLLPSSRYKDLCENRSIEGVNWLIKAWGCLLLLSCVTLITSGDIAMWGVVIVMALCDRGQTVEGKQWRWSKVPTIVSLPQRHAAGMAVSVHRVSLSEPRLISCHILYQYHSRILIKHSQN